MKDIRYTIIAGGVLGTLWKCHPRGGHLTLEYMDGPWLLTRFNVGTKIRVGTRTERNGRPWYETPLVANIVSIKRLNPTESRVIFNGLDGSTWALDVSPDAIQYDERLEDIIEATATYKLDDLYFLNKSYNKGELG